MTNRSWAVPVILQSGELFSSWLIRSALANGCDPLAFTDAIWPKWRIWIIDIDRDVPVPRQEMLSELYGIPRHYCEEGTLRNIACRITDDPVPKNNFWYWILSVGARNRRRSGGLQYCPACLAEDRVPYFRKQWRYAWHTVCELHGNMLLDRCNYCKAPVQPHRLTAEKVSVTVCPMCNRDLRDVPVKHEIIDDSARLFQQSGDRALAGGQLLVHGKTVSISEWFSIARLYWELLRRVANGGSDRLTTFGNYIGLQNLPASLGGYSIEQARTRTRHEMLGGVYKIMVLPGEELLDQLKAASITLQTFCPGGMKLPCSLAKIAFKLPNNPRTRSITRKTGAILQNGPKPRKLVERMMQRLAAKTGIRENH